MWGVGYFGCWLLVVGYWFSPIFSFHVTGRAFHWNSVMDGGGGNRHSGERADSSNHVAYLNIRSGNGFDVFTKTGSYGCGGSVNCVRRFAEINGY